MPEVLTSAQTGRLSEITAAVALIRNGYEVAEPLVVSSYDYLIKRPGRNIFEKAQIKTVCVREDRDGALVVKGAKNSGVPYSLDEASVIIGVDRFTAYIIENREQSEYWAKDEVVAAGKWEKVSLL
ncbi:hypothetical protein [Exiguobacterium undae]|uniref:hypothetical protein n=1 Tax=Exiguobacterium undae TaxID=169177 RepID=UPI0011850518|nr:hypothetical protein [Exiguobacterium undae]